MTDQRSILQSCLTCSADLDLLFLLRRSPETFWTATAAATALGADQARVASAFEAFMRIGLVERAHTAAAYRYAAGDANRDAVDALVAAYHERPGEVLAAIHRRAGGIRRT